MLRSLLLYLSECNAPKTLLTRLPGGRRLPERFIAGEALPDALRVVRALNAGGFEVTLDYLGESVGNRQEASNSCRTYIDLLASLSAEGLRSHISIKLTALGLAIGTEVAQEHLRAIWQAAASYRNFVRIDMEGSAYAASTLDIFRAAGAPRDTLGVVVQAYLYRSEKDVDDLLQCETRIRLVKGAYNEPPSVAFPHKPDVDRNFVRLMKTLLASGGYHAIATHDPRMIGATVAFAREQQIGPGRFEFQMLYGIRRDLQRELLRKGYRLRVYVPYGERWYPYFMRRLAERPANLFFLLRNLFRAS